MSLPDDSLHAGADLVMLPVLASSLQADLNMSQEDFDLLVVVQACGFLCIKRRCSRVEPMQLVAVKKLQG